MMAVFTRTMDEAAWLACTEPRALLPETILRCHPRDRQLRLFACACWHRLEHLLGDERLHSFLETLEQFAEGRLSEQQLGEAVTAVWEARLVADGGPRAQRVARELIRSGAHHRAHLAAQLASAAALNAAAWVADWAVAAEARAQCDLLRDIFRNPFQAPPAPDASWRTPTAQAVAQQIYEERDFAALPILADLLEEAGCDHPGTLAHCRELGSHVRGCWVLDLVRSVD